MTLSVEQKRDMIKGPYMTFKWIDRVNRMSPAQVCAVYQSFLNKGLFDKKKVKQKKGPVAHQMNLWEFGVEKMNRAERRRMNSKDMASIKDEIQDNLASMLLCVWVNVLWDKGVPYDTLCDYVSSVVDECEKIDDFDKYRKKTFEKTGISIIRTP